MLLFFNWSPSAPGTYKSALGAFLLLEPQGQFPEVFQ
jgi:hypothetical protein